MLYEENKEQYDNNKKAYSHLNWSIGLYKLCIGEIDYDVLKKGVKDEHINVKRILIYFAVKIGLKKSIAKTNSLAISPIKSWENGDYNQP